MGKQITWDYKRTPVTEEVLSEKEKLLGIRLPDDFREVFIENHGAGPVPEYYYAPNGNSRNFGFLLALDEDEDEIEFTEANSPYMKREHDMPHEVVIFSIDPAGNFLCFDYNQLIDGYPAIIFWDHEVEGGNLKKICNTFTELLDMLHDDEDDVS
ncbi:SMI1/KNR4 family protein [Kroppenstedtia eburnea]|uniref:SMI1 / KNR4 family (SUKH-1) n=1 Tax=Kroppenstedtia eburnea TaxID=714067 RepID=A0A1N7Q8W8_9BACL|nr:SMI1/KNR4 family protein [Kroppenstedtia eburnea]QKI82586.1 SMI1/KNR4 family protein [Kroppenstedtia eburnea]SIT19300.1 SMI1 / KNR4 family (SUKH-1) [Kroppenstedtia eburnea]